VNQRWRYGGWRPSPDSIAEAEGWEEAKQGLEGLHFLAVQPDPDRCGAGLCLSFECEMPFASHLCVLSLGQAGPVGLHLPGSAARLGQVRCRPVILTVIGCAVDLLNWCSCFWPSRVWKACTSWQCSQTRTGVAQCCGQALSFQFFCFATLQRCVVRLAKQGLKGLHFLAVQPDQGQVRGRPVIVNGLWQRAA
jgi:hypothetical protein